MTLDWAERMHAEKVFLDERLLDSSRTWATYAPLWGYMKKVKRVSSDWIFGYVATAIGCPQFGFAEVMSQWRKPVENPQLLYAVTHPVRKPSHHTDR